MRSRDEITAELESALQSPEQMTSYVVLARVQTEVMLDCRDLLLTIAASVAPDAFKENSNVDPHT